MQNLQKKVCKIKKKHLLNCLCGPNTLPHVRYDRDAMSQKSKVLVLIRDKHESIENIITVDEKHIKGGYSK